MGTLGAAVWTGLQAANTVPHDDTTHAMMLAHQYLGIAVLALGVLLSLWLLISKSTLPKPKPVFVGGLFLIAALLLQQVDLGMDEGMQAEHQEHEHHAH